MTYRVVHFGTGFAGTHALRGIIEHPELELVGLVVHSDEKVGKDAGALAGLHPTGVVATQDLDSVQELGADAFCYMATTHGRFKVAIGEVERILASGTNVVTTSFGLLVNPATARPDVLATLDDAARRGGVSFLSTGIEPGFFSDYLPVVLSGCASRVDSIRIYELATYWSGEQSDEVAFTICGFGQPLDTVPPIVNPAGMLPWEGCVRAIAAQLDVSLDGVETSYDAAPCARDLRVPGSCHRGGHDRRLPLRDLRRGRRHDQGRGGARDPYATGPSARLARGLAGDAYRIVIEGSPSLSCEFNFSEGDDHLAGGFNITAMRAVNAIPLLCEHAPGVVSTFDLPPVTARGQRGEVAPSRATWGLFLQRHIEGMSGVGMPDRSGTPGTCSSATRAVVPSRGSGQRARTNHVKP